MKTEDGVKYITQIDDYKRELLMRVRNRIENAKRFESFNTDYICYAIKSVLFEETSSYFLDYILLEDFIAELFPEFIDMFDGFCWYEDGGKMKALLGYTWWESGWKEPRIRILDTILQTW